MRLCGILLVGLLSLTALPEARQVQIGTSGARVGR